MDKREVSEILDDWNFWGREPQTGIERASYLDSLEGMLKTNQVITISGPRRSGKSFLMRQLVKRIIGQGIKPNNTLIINFEDQRLGEINAKSLGEVYETYVELLSPTQKPFVFLDEVQEVKDWEKWVRTTHELGNARVVVSGSNAKLLGHELSTLLTGRHLDLTVFPLSFEEFLKFNGVKIKDKLDMASKRIELRRLLRKYIEFGGFPEVALSPENKKREIILKYFEDIVNKDLIIRYRVRKPEKLKALIKFYLSNISSPITFNSIEKFLGLSSDT
ncbi:ATP-binding protein, partial [archaeon]|nr:ATP-binding protein [archaeon]